MNTKNTVLKELNRSTKHFVDYMTEYAQREIRGSLSEEKWDMDQVIHHVILTDQSIMKILGLSFKKIKKGHFSKYQMRDMLLNRVKKIKNPEQVSPRVTEEKSITEWLTDFKLQREGLALNVQNGVYDLESEETFPHFQLGLLTRRDWLYLVCFHSDRHIAQMQELLFCN